MLKLSFVEEAVGMEDPRVEEKKMPPAACRALKWISKTAPREICQMREAQGAKIKARGEKLKQSGAVAAWLSKCSSSAREVLRDVNGPLLEELLADSHYEDEWCFELLESGARLMGLVEECGLGKPIAHSEMVDMDALRAECRSSNLALLQQLKSVKDEEELVAQTVVDAALGRMTYPVPSAEN